MTVKGYLVFVPLENVATVEHLGSGQTLLAVWAEDRIAGPFEVRETVLEALARALTTINPGD